MQIAHCSDVVGLRSNDRKSTIDYPDYNKARLCMVIHNAHAVPYSRLIRLKHLASFIKAFSGVDTKTTDNIIIVL